MDEMDFLEWHRRLSGRHYRVCYMGKIASAGSMFGTALLFPFTYGGELPFRALSLTIFAVSLVVLVALHLEPFIRVGPYTTPLALFILLLVVLQGASSTTIDMKAWLPLYVVFFCSLTAIIHQFPFRITRNESPVVAQVHGRGLPTEQPSSTDPGNPTHRPSSEWSHPRPASVSYRNDPSSYQNMGPGSSRSELTSSDGTELTLRNLHGARRDPHSALIFGNSHVDHSQLAADTELGYLRPSQDSAMESRAPLLGSYD